MSAIVGIITRRGLRIEACYNINLIRVSYHYISHSFQFHGYLNQLYINNKTEHFSYKSGCGVMHIKAFKRRAGLGYRQTALGY